MQQEDKSLLPYGKRPKKYFSRFKKPLVDFPNFVESQIASFDWLLEKGLKELFAEFSPIKDYSDKKFELSFTSFELAKPKGNEHFAKDNKMSHEVPLKAMVKLKNKTLGTVKEQEIFLADFPLMTPHGTFIINGIERVIVPQLARSFGMFFTAQEIRRQDYPGSRRLD